LFVPLVEEGRDDHNAVVQAAVGEYLEPVRRLRPAVVILGCTHYPLLRTAIEDFMGEGVVLIDTAEATAGAVESLLRRCDALSSSIRGGRLLCYVSDDPQRFQSLSARFLGGPIMDVVRACPEEFFAEPTASAERLRVSA
jgi:glutamate racemase